MACEFALSRDGMISMCYFQDFTLPSSVGKQHYNILFHDRNGLQLTEVTNSIVKERLHRHFVDNYNHLCQH